MGLRFEEGFVRAGRHRFFWKSLGSGANGTLLCLHGGPGIDHWSTIEVSDLAPFGYRIVFFDQLGCGRSDRPASMAGYTMQRAADDVEAVRLALRLGRCVLYGYSFGAALGLQTILQHPKGFRALILSSGWASQRQLDQETNRLVQRLPPRHRSAIIATETLGRPEGPRYREALAAFRKTHMFGGVVPPFEISMGLANLSQEVQAAFFGTDQRLTAPAGGSMAGWDVTDQLGRIAVPTLVTVGGRDHVTPRCARTIHRGIRKSKLIVYPDSGHSHAYQERTRYMAALLRFLGSLPPAE